MQNLTSKIFGNFLFCKPQRLIYQEVGPDKRQPDAVEDNLKEQREEMKNDLFNNVLRPQDGEGRPGMLLPEDFINKYHELLVTDFESYKSCLNFFDSMGIEKYRKAAEFGYVYLNSTDPRIVEDYTTSVVWNLAHGLDSTKEHPLYANNPQLLEQAKKQMHDFLTYFIKEKASKEIDNNPIALAITLRAVAGHADLLLFLESKVKSFDLSDEQFEEIIRQTVFFTPGGEKALPGLLKLLTQSKEKPFESKNSFMQKLSWALFYVKKTQDTALITLVLRRGKSFIDGDNKTKEEVNEQLKVHNLKLEDLLK